MLRKALTGNVQFAFFCNLLMHALLIVFLSCSFLVLLHCSLLMRLVNSGTSDFFLLEDCYDLKKST